MHDFLTSREVADLLRIKERKLYELCADGVLPVTRVTGKLLFPRNALFAWLQQNTDYGAGLPALKPRPAVVAGSHDTLLEWALRASKSQLATWFDGSGDGIERLADGQCMAAGIHFHSADGEDANIVRLTDRAGREPVILTEWAKRQQGLVVGARCADRIGGVSDLPGNTIVERQPGSGSHALFRGLMDASGIDPDGIKTVASPALNENDVAQAVASGHADAGLAIEAVARQYGLKFLPLVIERFDLAIWRRDYFEEPLQRLFAFAVTQPFRAQAAEFGGYDISGLGTVHFNGP